MYNKICPIDCIYFVQGNETCFANLNFFFVKVVWYRMCDYDYENIAGYFCYTAIKQNK